MPSAFPVCTPPDPSPPVPRSRKKKSVSFAPEDEVRQLGRWIPSSDPPPLEDIVPDSVPVCTPVSSSLAARAVVKKKLVHFTSPLVHRARLVKRWIATSLHQKSQVNAPIEPKEVGDGVVLPIAPDRAERMRKRGIQRLTFPTHPRMRKGRHLRG